ncbi:alpha/beta hydrolase family protein [Patulibacter defluvii]|uniref:alpha/beta hydrolase family protein n=1 Tax=Patulibacter defluvii TaxID=3095358 RepID=UPI002A7633A7|nr:alpha/beta hydrolase family protein [Patulibacter sp. DM4]
MSAAALPKPGDLPLTTQLAYRATVASDYALRAGLASVVAGAVLPSAVTREGRHEHERLAFYAELAAAGDPAQVFLPPERVDVVATAGRGPGVPGGRVELLRFASPYVARNPALRRDYARHVNNGTARAQHWRHEDGPRPTLCVIHGFGASPAWFNSAFLSLPRFFAEGWDVALYTLPFHGSRRGRWAPVNGVELFAHGMAHFSEAILHAIHDFRALLDHLQAQGAPRIGVTGLSLGGYTSALAAAVDPRLDFAIPNAAVTCLPPLIDRWFPANVASTAARRLAGIPRDLLEAALLVHSPLHYPPAIARERLMIVAGLGDRLAPPSQSVLLWEHWQRPELHWFPGSHVLHLGRGRYLDAMRRLIETPSEEQR